MTRDFLLNFAAGVFTTAFLWLLSSVLAPRYRAWMSRAPSLKGKWRYFDEDGPQAPEAGTAAFDQTGDAISVHASRTRSRSGRAHLRTFEYMGHFHNGYVQLEFEESESNKFSGGNLILKVSSDQKSLQGFTVYFDHDEGRVVAHPIIFRRA